MNTKIKFHNIVLIVVGVISFTLSIVTFAKGQNLHVESKYEYGGDAYTGIQNAAAGAANNVAVAGRNIGFGIGSVLLVSGLLLIGFGVAPAIDRDNS